MFYHFYVLLLCIIIIWLLLSVYLSVHYHYVTNKKQNISANT